RGAVRIDPGSTRPERSRLHRPHRPGGEQRSQASCMEGPDLRRGLPISTAQRAVDGIVTINLNASKRCGARCGCEVRGAGARCDVPGCQSDHLRWREADAVVVPALRTTHVALRAAAAEFLTDQG